MSQCLLYLGHHKCASITLMNIFERTMTRAGIASGMLPRPYFGIRHFMEAQQVNAVSVPIIDTSELDELDDFKAFHVIRDPRDLLVSAYYSHLSTHRTEGWDELLPHRERLQAASREEGLLLEMEFSIITWTFDILQKWNFGDPRILEMRFEDFTRDRAAFLMHAFRFLDILNDTRPAGSGTLTMRDLEEEIQGNRMVQFAARQPSHAQPRQHHFRKGQPGEWSHHFTPGIKTAFKSRFPGLVSRLGYETSENW